MREKYRLRMCENRVLRKTSGSQRNELVGTFRNMHNVLLTNISRVIKTSRVIRTELAARMRKRKGADRVWKSQSKILPITCHEGPDGE